MENRKGFTLIELLIVVAVVSLISVLLLPAIKRARERATKANAKPGYHYMERRYRQPSEPATQTNEAGYRVIIRKGADASEEVIGNIKKMTIEDSKIILELEE